MDRDQTIAKIRQHADEFRKRGVTGMYLFGSLARGEAGAGSDVDIFFDYEQDGHFSLFDIMDVHEHVEKILSAKADVVPRKSLHRRIRDKVVTQAIQIF